MRSGYSGGRRILRYPLSVPEIRWSDRIWKLIKLKYVTCFSNVVTSQDFDVFICWHDCSRVNLVTLMKLVNSVDMPEGY
jgi:hypothetical protein